MKITYLNVKESSHLVETFYHVSYPKNKLPLSTRIIPLGYSGFTYVYTLGQSAFVGNKKNDLNDLILNGQFNKSYKFNVNKEGYSCGINFKPTALHKLTGLDVSKFTNKHTLFNNFDNDFSLKLRSLFLNHNNNFVELFKNIDSLLSSVSIIENKNIASIDKAIDYIIKKDGMLSVKDLLNIIPFSQKTLETQFKKIVGLTPAKFIRIKRFTTLMKQYEKHKIDFKDLIYMYDYYDKSHFNKDFKIFTSKTLKEYFKEDFSLIKQSLKNN